MNTNIWDADIAIDAALAARLITCQFPALAPVSIAPFGLGWDNVAFRVNGDLVFRFPRRQIAIALLETEARCLPLLAPRLPTPIPLPLYRGEPEADFPYPFLGYRLLPGTTADRVAWTEDERTNLAVPLAKFLRTLHEIPVDEAMKATVPGDTLGRADLCGRVVALHERLDRLAPLVRELDWGAVRGEVERLSQTPPSTGEPCLLHGDLYARHLLIDNVDHARQLCGVIDWGDLHRGDRAIDLSIAFTFLPPQARPTFRAAYGSIDKATWDRARFRGLHYGAILTLYGADTGDRAIEAAGQYALRAVGVDAG